MHQWHFHRLIAKHPLLKGMRQKHLLAIEHCAELVAFETGDVIGRVGDSAEFFYLITAGCVELSLPLDGTTEVPLMRLNKKALLGWSWLFKPNQWQYNIRAQTPIDAIAFNVACVRAMIEADHELGFQLMRRFGSLIETRQQHLRDAIANGLQPVPVSVS